MALTCTGTSRGVTSLTVTGTVGGRAGAFAAASPPRSPQPAVVTTIAQTESATAMCTRRKTRGPDAVIIGGLRASRARTIALRHARGRARRRRLGGTRYAVSGTPGRADSYQSGAE